MMATHYATFPEVCINSLSTITGIAGCCARTASGHTAALPSPAMSSLRLILVSPGFMAAYAQDKRTMKSPV
jgi:hypothetical protein